MKKAVWPTHPRGAKDRDEPQGPNMRRGKVLKSWALALKRIRIEESGEKGHYGGKSDVPS